MVVIDRGWRIFKLLEEWNLSWFLGEMEFFVLEGYFREGIVLG